MNQKGEKYASTKYKNIFSFFLLPYFPLINFPSKKSHQRILIGQFKTFIAQKNNKHRGNDTVCIASQGNSAIPDLHDVNEMITNILILIRGTMGN